MDGLGMGLVGLAVAIIFAVAAWAAASAQGRATEKAMDAIARQPEAANDVRGSLIIALALMEAIAIYGLVLGIIVAGRIG
jgi:F-type H+-transporting ATPase subunit c